MAGFLGLSGVCCACGWLHYFANVGNMVGVAVLLVGVVGAGGWNGGSPWATRQGENEALNGVLNEVLNGGWWRQKKGCPKVPISYVFGGGKNGQKWAKNGIFGLFLAFLTLFSCQKGHFWAKL